MEEQLKELTTLLTQCWQEVYALKQQSHQQDQRIAAMQETFHVFSDSINEIIDNLNKMENTSGEQFEALVVKLFYLERMAANMKYEIFDPSQSKENYFYPHIADSSIAIDKIVHEHKSIARFGDGEFAIMMNVERQKFQKNDPLLAARLKETLHSDLPDLLIAIADNYGNLDKYNDNGALGIRLYMTNECRKAHQALLDPTRTYYDAYMSRPYALYRDNDTDAPQKRFKHLQQIWQDRDVIFVEGALTRLGVGNDLFANAHSIKRIIAPPTSSFDKYDEILAASLQYATPDTLFLLAIGPSAGVLAYDLCANGYQAVDIGHVDLEYEWFLQGTGGRCPVPTKYNNEFAGGDNVEPIDDAEYSSQILCSFA